MNILEVQDLCKTYGKGEAAVQALRHATFSVRKGEFIAIIGESGSGKSTLLKVVGALDKATSGKVWIDGQDIFSMPEKKLTVFRRQHIGFIFQSFNLIPELNVEQNITFPLLLDYKRPDQRFVNELLNVLGLTERRHHLPSQLSGGQQQRVAIGRALVTRPALILADEPTGNLDSKNSQETVVLLSKGEVDSKKIRVEFSLEDMDMSEFQDGATYTQIKDYVLEHSGLKVSNLYISQIKRKCGIGVGKNYNLPKSEDSRQPQCPPEKEKAIREAFKYFGII